MLESDQAAALADLARVKNISVSSLVRKYIEDGVKIEKSIQKISGLSPKQKVLRSVAKARKLKLSKGVRDLSENLDHYLYGAPRKYGSS